MFFHKHYTIYTCPCSKLGRSLSFLEFPLKKRAWDKDLGTGCFWRSYSQGARVNTGGDELEKEGKLTQGCIIKVTPRIGPRNLLQSLQNGSQNCPPEQRCAEVFIQILIPICWELPLGGFNSSLQGWISIYEIPFKIWC